jgi:hypothetical protein
MPDPKDVFEATPQSVERVLMEQGRGFYVPSYQRPYAWDKNNVQPLFDSILEGIGALAETADAITFIGTFIFVHDTAYKTVEPQVKDVLPGQVFLVIDGQQRLTTLCVFAAALHHELSKCEARLLRQGELDQWLKSQLIVLKTRLLSVLRMDKLFGDDQERFYPRLIRAHEDSWSCWQASARYESPTAALLHAYSRWAVDRAAVEPTHAFTPFRWGWEDAVGTGDPCRPHFEVLAGAYRIAHQALKRFQDGHVGEEELVPDAVLSLTGLTPAQAERYFVNPPPPSIAQLWSGEDDDQVAVWTKRTSRLLMFTRFLLERVAVTQVLVKKEEYAFDLFEALNTRGEPLTAYETFRPVVIKAERLELFQQSPSAAHLETVERFVAKERAKTSDRLLIPFALYQEGYKLRKRPRDQRNWLRRTYDASPGLAAKREYTFGMSVVATFLNTLWDGAKQGDFELVEEWLKSNSMEATDRRWARFCLRVLADANHDITAAALSRFVERILLASTGDRAAAAREFAVVLRAVTAFWVVWRGAHVGTSGIDKVYDRLMKGAAAQAAGAAIEPLNRSAGTVPASSAVVDFLRRELEGAGLAVRESWVNRAASVPVYTQSRELTRLLLAAASHDQIPDETQPGFTRDGKQDSCPTLTMDWWLSGLEIEHVAPLKNPGTWSADVYTEERVNTLGNLIMLPPDSNRSAGNKDWRTKRLYYRVLASDDPAEVESLIAEARASGVDVARPTEELLARARFVPHLRALALVGDDEWRANLVSARSTAILVLAWRRLGPWLGLG